MDFGPSRKAHPVHRILYFRRHTGGHREYHVCERSLSLRVQRMVILCYDDGLCLYSPSLLCYSRLLVPDPVWKWSRRLL